MSQKTADCHVTVLNSQGLHARPAHVLVAAAKKFASDIEIIKEGEAVDAKSILSVLTLAAVQGTELTVRATGPDAEEAVCALAELFSRQFQENNDAEEEAN